ncbi:hypothetical protein RND71_003301 [Anisodus tanguticus]|uniref:Uncharacterized protein n=1 Tax=Anisodus tanguticus TaxID=243964 RepID=A0AAE1VX10_9SOLA|nr:hypothetical protein RND71_003301 [Anisodus tanguticus]
MRINNDIQEGDEIQIWAVRMDDDELIIVLVKLLDEEEVDIQEENDGDGVDSKTNIASTTYITFGEHWREICEKISEQKSHIFNSDQSPMHSNSDSDDSHISSTPPRHPPPSRRKRERLDFDDELIEEAVTSVRNEVSDENLWRLLKLTYGYDSFRDGQSETMKMTHEEVLETFRLLEEGSAKEVSLTSIDIFWKVVATVAFGMGLNKKDIEATSALLAMKDAVIAATLKNSEIKDVQYIFDIPSVAYSTGLLVVDLTNHLQTLKVSSICSYYEDSGSFDSRLCILVKD